MIIKACVEYTEFSIYILKFKNLNANLEIHIFAQAQLLADVDIIDVFKHLIYDYFY